MGGEGLAVVGLITFSPCVADSIVILRIRLFSSVLGSEHSY